MLVSDVVFGKIMENFFHGQSLSKNISVIEMKKKH